MRKVTSIRLYRWFRYFQDGFGYISIPIAIVNFLTVFYYLLVSKVAFLQVIFPDFIIFTIAVIGVFFPLSAGVGWWHIKKSQMYESENILMTENNPIAVYGNRVTMEMQRETLKALNISPSQEFNHLLAYWQRLDEKIKWRPTNA